MVRKVLTISLFSSIVYSVLFSLLILNTKDLHKTYVNSTYPKSITDKVKSATINKKSTTTLIATGDVIPARSVNTQINSYNNLSWPFEKTAQILKSADITLINLETPLIENCPLTNEGMKFCGDSKNVEGLVTAGIDIANLANNHFGNYGKEGMLETQDLLQKNDILYTGVDGAEFIEANGTKFAFLGYNNIGYAQEGIAWAEENSIKQQISETVRKADVVVVSFHWGTEYTDTPNETQKKFAHLSIDSGADLVIGNHPHWEQPGEFYKGKYIKYAHGNFVFDQMWSEETKKGVIGKYTFEGSELVNVEFIPVYIEDFGQPRLINQGV